MSDVNYNLSHGLCMVYLEMTAADGKFEQSEMDEAAKKVLKWEDVFEYAAEKTWDESIVWFKSFDSVESRVDAVFNVLGVLKDKMPKAALVEIAKDFNKIGATVDMLKSRSDLNPEEYANFAKDWINSGATLIGGCCEVGPAHIAELKRKFG